MRGTCLCRSFSGSSYGFVNFTLLVFRVVGKIFIALLGFTNGCSDSVKLCRDVALQVREERDPLVRSAIETLLDAIQIRSNLLLILCRRSVMKGKFVDALDPS